MAAGHSLFWKHGFRRVTIEEICQKANVCKMTFYKYFADKTDLAKKVFNKIVEEGEEQIRKIMKEDSPPPEKIRKMIMLKMEGTNNVSYEFLQDFYSLSGELKDYVEKRTRSAWDMLIIDFKEAQNAGIFRKDFKAELVIKIQSKIIELLEDKSVISMYDSQQEMLMDFAKFMFYGVAPHD